MKRILQTLAVLIASYMTATAIPARPGIMTIRQPDGTEIHVQLTGDEYAHCYQSTDGIPLVCDDNMTLWYAEVCDKGLAVSNILAHDPSERTVIENDYIKTNADRLRKAMCEQMDEYRAVNDISIVKSRQASTQSRVLSDIVPRYGEYKGLVILVEFQDVKMSRESARDDFDNIFNKPGYNRDNHIGSVSDYFRDQSYGMFGLNFDVVGPFTLEHDMKYYGANKDSGSDKRAYAAVLEAVRQADKLVNYNDYDWDGDGEVEQVFMIYAGYSESSGGSPNTIWPHKSELDYYLSDDDRPLLLDGVKINTYACSSELFGSSGKTYSGIGTACHEFSHCLGFPDLYDTDYSGGFGMDHHDLMCSGSYNGPDGHGEVPCGYSAYERWQMGWLELTELTEAQRVIGLPPLNDNQAGYIYFNPVNSDEYLIYENRQNYGWFSYIGTSNKCHGLLVTHIDYNANIWRLNKVNNSPSHQRLVPIVADADLGTKVDKRYITTDADLEGDYFPGSQNVTELLDYTHTNVWGVWYNADANKNKYLKAPLTNIREKYGLISFDFMGGIVVPVPEITGIKITGENSFDVEWTPLDDVDSYTVQATEYREQPSDFQVFVDNFFQLKQDSEASSTDISIRLNKYTSNPGWGGQNVYGSAYGPQIGNDTQMGYMQTPRFVHTGEDLTVKLNIINDAKATVTVELLDDKGAVVGTQTITCEGSDNNKSAAHIVNFDSVEPDQNYMVRIKPDSKIILESIVVYSYHFTDKDFDGSIIDSLIKPADKVTAEGIYQTSHSFTDVKTCRYNVRVRAEKDGVYSEWSKGVLVNLDTQNSLKDVYDTNDIPRHIYSVSGIEVECMDHPGIYIIDYGTHCQKAIVK